MGVFELSNRVLAGSLALVMLGAQAGQAGKAQATAQTQPQQAIPDAPSPHAVLPNLGSVTPGQGTASTSTVETAVPAPSAVTAPIQPAESGSQPIPTEAPPEADVRAEATLHVQVNYVEVPFSVKDAKQHYVAGLTRNDVQIFENGNLQRIVYFTPDFHALSVALVIDQSMTYDNMLRVDDSLGALQDAFTKYDEVALFKYNNGPSMVTDFTGAQSARLTDAISISKGSGREPLMAGSLSGPMSQTTVINNQNFDPNTAAVRGQTGIQLSAPREVHTLNDAILEAAKSLSNRSIERHRVIYVISDGKEYGSVAKTKDVIKYLQANNIEVDGTLVGDSALPVIGFLDRIHLPDTMHDNILPQYAHATGGNFDAEFRIGGIERSFAKIAGEVRNRYTLGYNTPEPPIDGKYRTREVRVLNHGNDLTILTAPGYWPSAVENRPRPTPAQ